MRPGLSTAYFSFVSITLTISRPVLVGRLDFSSLPHVDHGVGSCFACPRGFLCQLHPLYHHSHDML